MPSVPAEPMPSIGGSTDQPARPYRVLARTYRPQRLSELIGQDALVRTLTNALHSGRVAHAFLLTGIRGVGKTTTARIIARALNCIGPDGSGPADARAVRAMRALRRDRRRAAHRRARDGCRDAYRHRRHPRDRRQRALRADLGAHQGLHHRRSAHAVGEGFQRPSEDPRGAAAADHLHLRHDRSAQGAGDGAVALPALRSAPGRGRAAAAPPRRDRRQGGGADRARRARADRARRRGFGARRAVAARPGDRAGRRRGDRGGAGPGDARAGRSLAACSTCSSMWRAGRSRMLWIAWPSCMRSAPSPKRCCRICWRSATG